MLIPEGPKICWSISDSVSWQSREQMRAHSSCAVTLDVCRNLHLPKTPKSFSLSQTLVSFFYSLSLLVSSHHCRLRCPHRSSSIHPQKRTWLLSPLSITSFLARRCRSRRIDSCRSQASASTLSPICAALFELQKW